MGIGSLEATSIERMWRKAFKARYSCAMDRDEVIDVLRAVEKYRSAEEMNAAPVRPSRGEGFDRFLRHCARYWLLAPRVYPRGVVKFRSAEEAEKSRAEVAKENAQRLRSNATP